MSRFRACRATLHAPRVAEVNWRKLRHHRFPNLGEAIMKHLISSALLVAALGLSACNVSAPAVIAGPPGPPGAQGNQGNAGDTGATGAVGNQGNTATPVRRERLETRETPGTPASAAQRATSSSGSTTINARARSHCGHALVRGRVAPSMRNQRHVHRNDPAHCPDHRAAWRF